MQLGNEGLGVAPNVVATAELVADPVLSPGRAILSVRERRVTLALLASVFAVHFLDRQLLAILIPPIKSELGLSDTALGFLSGFAFTVFFSTVGLLIARIAGRAERARVITWSLVAFSVITALCGLATTFWQLLAALVYSTAARGGAVFTFTVPVAADRGLVN